MALDAFRNCGEPYPEREGERGLECGRESRIDRTEHTTDSTFEEEEEDLSPHRYTFFFMCGKRETRSVVTAPLNRGPNNEVAGRVWQ